MLFIKYVYICRSNNEYDLIYLEKILNGTLYDTGQQAKSSSGL